MKRKKIAVIGLNTFGVAVMRALTKLGHERMGVDADRARVQALAAELHDVVEADATEPDALVAAGVEHFDGAVVAFGSNLAASVIVTMNLKQLGVPFVVAKARSETEAEALKRVGADLIVFPERDSARHLAKMMMFSGFIDADSLADGFSLVKVRPLRSIVGKQVKDLPLRAQFNLNILLIEQEDGMRIDPVPAYKLRANDTLYIAGKDASLRNYSRELDKETKERP